MGMKLMLDFVEMMVRVKPDLQGGRASGLKQRVRESMPTSARYFAFAHQDDRVTVSLTM